MDLTANRDLTDKHNRNRIESESGKESKRDINISVRVIEQDTFQTKNLLIQEKLFVLENVSLTFQN